MAKGLMKVKAIGLVQCLSHSQDILCNQPAEPDGLSNTACVLSHALAVIVSILPDCAISQMRVGWEPTWSWAFDMFIIMSAIGLLSRVTSLMCWFMPWLRIGNASGLLSAKTM